ncbi:MAG: hypothetical protein Q7T96_06410 [Methylobacter sp.]|nr:hypothetical protein [Methylobacter sp.]
MSDTKETDKDATNFMEIPVASTESIAERYRAAIQWMEQLGVKITTGRTSHYKRTIDYWNHGCPNASDVEKKDKFPEFINAIFEIDDFIDIYEAFRLEPVCRLEAIVHKLQKGVDGPINSVNESPKSTAARNFMFEALMAARSHRPRSGVNAILDAVSDTGIEINNKKVWVECKRITSIEGIEKNTGKASKQLETLLKKRIGSSHRGIVAIDITKILSPGDEIFVQENDTQLMNSADRIMERFIENHSSIWQRVYARRHKKVIGTIVRFSFMASSEARNLRVHATQWAVNPRYGISGSDDALLRSVVSAIKSK